jgi:hypothetical protein
VTRLADRNFRARKKLALVARLLQRWRRKKESPAEPGFLIEDKKGKFKEDQSGENGNIKEKLKRKKEEETRKWDSTRKPANNKKK